MKQTDVVLISPPTPTPGLIETLGVLHMSVATTPPLGLGYLSSVLRQHEYSVTMYNLFTGIKDVDKFLKIIVSKNPKIIGFLTMTDLYNNACLLASLLKKLLPETIIIFGGPHATFTDLETLENPFVDIVVRAEGEFTLKELADYYIRKKGYLSDIKNITYKDKDKIIKNPDRPFIEKLDDLPFPDRDFYDENNRLLSEEASSGKLTIISSRGCPAQCKFCVSAGMSGGKRRVRTPENVIKEILNVRKNSKTIILFADDTLTIDLPRLNKMLTLLKKENIKWVAESRVDVITSDLCKKMHESGCIALQFGVESGSQRMLNAMNKGITLKQIEDAVKYATDSGIHVVCTLMVGMPGDTHESIQETIEFTKTIMNNDMVLSFLACTTPYPGTYIFNHAQELNIKINTLNYSKYTAASPIIDSEHLKAYEIRNYMIDGLIEIIKACPDGYMKKFGYQQQTITESKAINSAQKT
jgi:radical SAM superfamily enzyme YgiQ (UPF0313 family)